MLNHVEHLLVILGEECSEVQKEASKCLRFGLNDQHPKYPGLNRERLFNEICEVYGSVELLVEEGVIPRPQDYCQKILAKKVRVREYMELSRRLGHLEGR